VVPYLVAKGETVESNGTHESRLRKMKNRGLFLPLLFLFDESIWPCNKSDGVPLCKLVLLPHKKMKESRLLLSLQSLGVLYYHSHQRCEVDETNLNFIRFNLALHLYRR